LIVSLGLDRSDLTPTSATNLVGWHFGGCMAGY
jgi:hypothetical protein